MTKVEIFDTALGEDFKENHEPAYRAAIIGADYYAKQEAIAFAEWLSINGWYLNKIKRWSNRNESSDDLIEVLSSTKSTDELYTLYQETQSKIIQ
jgi:hypothetical protein